jgi:hypothetical protein
MHFEAIKTKQERKFLPDDIIKAFEERNGVINKNCKTKAGRNRSKPGDYRLYWVIS